MLSPYQSVERPPSCAGADKEKQTHHHRKVRPRVTHHEPEALAGTEQFRDLGRRNRRQNYDQKWNAGQPGEQSNHYQKPADDLEGADKMGRKIGGREPDSRKPQRAHVWVDIFEDPLRKEDQTDGQADKYDTVSIPSRSQQ